MIWSESRLSWEIVDKQGVKNLSEVGDCAWKVLSERNRLKSERGRRFIKTSPLVSQKFNAHQETYIEFFSSKNEIWIQILKQYKGKDFHSMKTSKDKISSSRFGTISTLGLWLVEKIGKVQRLKIEIKSNWWYFEFVHCYHHHIIYLKNTSMYWYLPFINIEKDFKTDMELLVYCPN